MTDPPAPPFILRASGWRLGALNVAALALCLCVPPAIWLGWRPEHAEAYAIVGTTMFVFLFADFALWLWCGLRELRIQGDTITAILGWRRRLRIFRAADITELHESESLGRRDLQILLGAPASRIPGVFTVYPWPKIRLVTDPFDPDQAAEAIERIKSLVAHAQQPPPAPAAADAGQTPRDR